MLETINLVNAVVALTNYGVTIEAETDGENDSQPTCVAYNIITNGLLDQIEDDYLILDADEVIALAEQYTDFKAKVTVP